MFYFATDRKAPRKRIVAIDVNKPQEANWKTVVPESRQTLVSSHMVNKQLVNEYLADARSVVK
ncbi:MAG TPA: S9 family peptidase, partial [Ramlibacter sp.]